MCMTIKKIEDFENKKTIAEINATTVPITEINIQNDDVDETLKKERKSTTRRLSTSARLQRFLVSQIARNSSGQDLLFNKSNSKVQAALFALIGCIEICKSIFMSYIIYILI